MASTGAAVALAGPVRDIVKDIDPNMPISSVRTIEDFYYGNAAGLVFALTRVIGSMGLLGFSLALVGLYGLVAYSAHDGRERSASGWPSARLPPRCFSWSSAMASRWRPRACSWGIGSVAVGDSSAASSRMPG